MLPLRPYYLHIEHVERKKRSLVSAAGKRRLLSVILLLFAACRASASETSLSTRLTEITSGGIGYSNSTANLYVGFEYTTSLTSGHWHGTEASGIMFWETNTTGFYELSLKDIEFQSLFFRSVVSTNPIGDWTPYTNDIVQLISTNFIKLEEIEAISKFRSGQGHDYPDDFESCRSMKHYFYGYTNTLGSNINIYAPMDGTVSDLTDEESGTRIMIKSLDYPAYQVIIFHVEIDPAVTNGGSLTAGQYIGTVHHEDDDGDGDTAGTDIAVRISTIHNDEPKYRMVSVFDVMTDNVFSNYSARGATDRSDFIISASNRNVSPLICDGQTFIGPSNTVGQIYCPISGRSLWNGWGSITNIFPFTSP